MDDLVSIHEPGSVILSLISFIIIFSVVFCLFKCQKRKERLNIVHVDSYDESKCCCIILSNTKFVRAYSKLQEQIRLSLCLLVLFIIFINYLQNWYDNAAPVSISFNFMDNTFLLYLKQLLLLSPDSENIRLLATLIIISIDLSYIFIFLLCRRAIYRKVGDSLFLVLVEVISFSSTFYFDGILTVVWLIPILIYFLRVILTMLTLKQPNHNRILKNSNHPLNPTSNPSHLKYKSKNFKDIQLSEIPLKPNYDGPPPYSLQATPQEIIYSMMKVEEYNPRETPVGTRSYIFETNFPEPIKQRTESASLRLRSFGFPQNPEENELITRFRTLTL